jgi:hypothetical protein
MNASNMSSKDIDNLKLAINDLNSSLPMNRRIQSDRIDVLLNEVSKRQKYGAPGAQGLRDALNKAGVVTNPQTNAFESSYLPMVYNAIQSSSSSDANVARWKNMDYATFQKEVFSPNTEANPNPFKNAKVTYSNGKAFLNINDETKEQIDLGLLAGNNKFNQTITQFNLEAQAKKDELVKSTALYQKCINNQSINDVLNAKIVVFDGKKCRIEAKGSSIQIDFVLTPLEGPDANKSMSIQKIPLSSYSENPEGLYSSVKNTFDNFK